MDGNRVASGRLLRIARRIVSYKKSEDDGVLKYFQGLYDAIDGIAMVIKNNSEKSSIKLFFNKLFKGEKNFKVDNPETYKEGLEKALLGDNLDVASQFLGYCIKYVKYLNEMVSDIDNFYKNSNIFEAVKNKGPLPEGWYSEMVKQVEDKQYYLNDWSTEAKKHLKTVVTCLENCKGVDERWTFSNDAKSVLSPSIVSFEERIDLIVKKLTGGVNYAIDKAESKVDELNGKIKELKNHQTEWNAAKEKEDKRLKEEADKRKFDDNAKAFQDFADGLQSGDTNVAKLCQTVLDRSKEDINEAFDTLRDDLLEEFDEKHKSGEIKITVNQGEGDEKGGTPDGGDGQKGDDGETGTREGAAQERAAADGDAAGENGKKPEEKLGTHESVRRECIEDCKYFIVDFCSEYRDNIIYAIENGDFKEFETCFIELNDISKANKAQSKLKNISAILLNGINNHYLSSYYGLFREKRSEDPSLFYNINLQEKIHEDVMPVLRTVVGDINTIQFRVNRFKRRERNTASSRAFSISMRVARSLMGFAGGRGTERTAARSMVATKQIASADELGKDIFDMCDPENDRDGYWSWWLPNGMAFCVGWDEDDDGEYSAKAVTSRTDDMGEAYGIYFIEDGELPDIWVGMSLDDAKKAAADIISWANDCRFESADDAKQAVDEYYNGQFNKQELDEMVDEDAKTPDDMPLTFGQVKDWAFDNPDKLLKAANDVLEKEGLSSTFGMSVMFDIYWEYLNTPQKYYGFDPSDQALFENMCDCLYHGYGMDKSGWESTGISEQQAKELWDKALHCMGDFD